MLDLPEPSGPEDTADIFAPVGVYQLPSKVAAVSDHENYAFRGKHLSHLSLYQWRSIVLVKEKKNLRRRRKTKQNLWTTNWPNFKKKPNREKNCRMTVKRRLLYLQKKTLEVDQITDVSILIPITLYATHYQQLRSKQKIPLLIRLPPKNPSSKPEVLTDRWKKEARHFAQYYLTLFRPWTKVRFKNLN